MKAEDLPPPDFEWGDPSTEVFVQMQHPRIGGVPIRIVVDKRLCAVRFEDETEDRLTIVIEGK